ncbi:hypothetical protein B5X24_HaOG216092 [Helicoverpa armigera]|nr:hypothetical protein B5X24_HaOG216092 [Helicoverpa armigera]
MNCFVCNNKVELGQLLKCTKCKVGYHYSCVNITSAQYSDKQSQLKSKYKCDSCLNITQRVRVTDDTPVRGMNTRSSSMEKQQFSQSMENNSNMEGISLVIQKTIQDNMSGFLEMVKEIIATNINALETKLIHEIKTTVSDLVHENSQLRRDLNTASKKCVTLEDEIKVLKSERRNNTHQEVNTSSSEIKLPAKSVPKSQNIPQEIIKVVNMNSSPALLSQPFQSAARARADDGNAVLVAAAAAPVRPAPLQSQPLEATYASVAKSAAGAETYSSWTEVKRKNPIKRGGNSMVVSIKAIERKKYLHVWRLDKATTEENLLEYIKKLIGEDSEITIEKLKPKTERDYASFKIGLIESKFNKLCDSEVWPLNTEFSEWIFFRRPTSNSGQAQANI